MSVEGVIGSAAVAVRRPRTYAATVAGQLRRHRGAMAGLAVLLLEVTVAVAAPWIAPHDPIHQDLLAPLQPPSRAHPWGTDEVGRDVLSRVIYGARISLSVGLISVGIAGVGGVFLGLVSGYMGGVVGETILRVMDLLLAFPGILLALAIVAVLGPGLFNVMIAVGIAGMPAFTRVTRAQTLAVREMDYVVGARAVGCTTGRILSRYILPNVLPSVIVLATLGLAGSILTAAGLSFLGLGAQPPVPEWGAMVSLGRAFLRQAWWVTTFPGVAIMVTVLAMNMLGDGLRDALDPRLRRG
ncbi:MAG: ABC transporter permease [Armatimonadota bacterium]|nr:ABC transporter permease [Armatimonadota bacterium]MDR7574340.1 ABC transporter permease [Armatimonadota bacterium]